MLKIVTRMFLFAALLNCFATTMAAVATGSPVRIGFDADFTRVGNTAAQEIELGIRIAIEEINAGGGVLGGRPVELVIKENRVNPARSIDNILEFAEVPDLVAVFAGRFTPVVIATVKPAHEKKLILLAPWSSGTSVINNGFKPNYAFRLSLNDLIAIPAMIDRARSIGKPRIGMMVANTAWGRDSREAAERYVSKSQDVKIVGVEPHNSRDTAMLTQYKRLIEQGAQAILLVASDAEAASFVSQFAALDGKMRVPLISHWGLTGGSFFSTVGGETLARIDLSVVQTFSLTRADPRKVKRVTDIARKIGSPLMPQDIPSPTGFAHAYDLAHILVRAINIAGSTDRSKVRDALEQVTNYDGLVRNFARPFTPDNHEALQASDVFFARYRADGALVPVVQGDGRANTRIAPK